MTNQNIIRVHIKEKIFNDIDWMNPYWLDEIKDEYSEMPASEIDKIYSDILQEKINSIPDEELRKILSEQSDETSANQNFLLQHLIEEKLGLISN